MTENDCPSPSELSINTPGNAHIKELVDHISLRKQLQKDIEILLKESTQKVETLKKGYFEQGYVEGCIKGFNALLEISREKEHAIKNLEECIFTLVKEISNEVIGESLKLQPQTLLPRIKNAIQFYLDHSHEKIPEITLAISKKDYQEVGREIKKEFSLWNVIQDENLIQGAVEIKTNHGSIEIQPTLHLASILRYVSKSIRPPEEIESRLKESMEMLHAKWKGQLSEHVGH